MFVEINGVELDRTKLTAGDKVWACAYRCTHNKEKVRFKQKPIYGMITASDTEAGNNRVLELHRKNGNLGKAGIGARYFVPFGKDGKTLVWSKAVLINSRRYTVTEEKSIWLYNDTISLEIKKYMDLIAAMRSERI